jgi:hypothetical protein
MSWGLAALGGATLVSGLFGSSSSKKAANAQAEATNRAAELQLQAQRETIAAQNAALDKSLQFQQRQFDQTRSDSEPWRTTGVNALGQLAGLADYDPTPTAESVMAEPGYQFGLNQGRDALQGSAAASGGLYSGRALKELTQFGNDYGTTKFNDAFNRQRATFGDRWNRLSGLAGTGQVATQQVGQAGQNLANNAANLYSNNANQTGSVLMGTAGNLGNLYTNNANAQGAARMGRANIWASGLNQLGGLAAYGMGGMGGQPNPLAGFFRFGTSGD